MKQLSGMDNLFLNQEKRNQYMHVAAMGIYDPSTAPGGKVRFKQVLDFFTSRLHKSKVFSRRLVKPPFYMDRPYWIEGGKIDIEYHVRHIGLPHPGDWRQLMIQIARIHSRPLDMTKPLWEAYIIERLDNIPGIAPGSFALYIKFHHAAIDGQMGAELIEAIHSLQAEFESAGMEGHTIITDREPNFLELATRAVGHRADQLVTASKLAVNISRKAVDLGKEYGPKVLEAGEQYLSRSLGAQEKSTTESEHAKNGIPKTRFNQRVSPHRVVDATGVSLDACQEIRQNVEAVTINDIFLTVAGGAMRRYLDAKGELPEASMSAMMPISTRTGKGQDVGNQIGLAITSLATDVENPIQRLMRVGAKSKATKKVSSSVGAELPSQLLNVLPGALVEKALFYTIGHTSNVTVSNVRGPNVPLYLAGAKMQMFMPVSVAFDGSGLNVTGFSYDGTLWITVTCCRAMMPDPAFFSTCINEEFDALLAAAREHGQQVKGKSPTGRAKKAAAKKPAAKKPAAKKQPAKSKASVTAISS
ncbi:MAG: wax ester/triacylglycerol synthase family O-acyltransferase [Candidatus Pelagadaptatus aseana]|uniref:wax ester/triacylglycerol synthase family O-acyltransferase n=1 Tax=Candidatus Pelagadaptatus aseana TaxID=3120508 RepID=UPI0039B1F48A